MKILLSLCTLFAILTSGCQPSHAPDHQAEVAERGADIMGFDLDRSTHIFEKIESGGRQQVVSDDNDAEQIQLIQAHMAEIAMQFSNGDFHGPEHIHGEHMAGLHDLIMGHEKLNIEYSDIEAGGQILYTTEESEMVNAIHAWFDAQVQDHGSHAQGHH